MVYNYSYERNVRNFWNKVDKTESCWNWKGATARGGYGNASLKGRPKAAHRLAWIITYGDIPDGLCVCHHCDNHLCVRPDHLFLGTFSDNTKDMFRKHRDNHAKGERGKAKLKEAEVVQIKRKLLNGETPSSIAPQFNISSSEIEHIKYGHSWKHIKLVEETK
jgi:hypothetical protein